MLINLKINSSEIKATDDCINFLGLLIDKKSFESHINNMQNKIRKVIWQQLRGLPTY